MSYDLEAINTLFAQIAECMHRNPARAMRLLGEAKVKTREALERAALAAQPYKGPWCCERAEAQGVPVCEECAEASAGYSAAMGSEATAAAQPAASAEPSDEEIAAILGDVLGKDVRPTAVTVDFARALLSRYGRPAGDAQPVAWVAADTLNSPHPKCVSSLAYMSQIDQDRGREYVPLYAAPVAAQKADDADPLQGAANWLVNALAKPRPTEIAARLLIGYNRAERLFDAAIAQQGKGEGGGNGN